LLNRNSIELLPGHDNEPYFYDYPQTKMYRKIFGCQIKIKQSGQLMHIITTHLESLPENDIERTRQFMTLEKVIANLKTKNYIVAGDFSIYTPNERVDRYINNAKIHDAWVEMGCPFKVKYTYNSKRNPNIEQNCQSRSDRILYGNSHLLTPKVIKLLGRENINDAKIPPSSHFGTFVSFNIKS